MDRKKEFRDFIGDGLSKKQFDLGFELWSQMKDDLVRLRVRRLKRKLERKVAIARREALQAIRDRIVQEQCEKRGHLSEAHRERVANLLREISDEH